MFAVPTRRYSTMASQPPASLIDGYLAFREKRLPGEQTRFQQLAETGQSPRIMLVGCCDSRVSPEVIFDARPGELFVVRNVANIVPPYQPDGGLHGTSAALEYGVIALKVEHIVVLGHGGCGGIAAYVDAGRKPLSPGDFVGAWISQLDNAAASVPECDRELAEDFARALEVANLRASVAALRTHPCIGALEARGRLQLHAAHFAIRTGVLRWLDQETGALRDVEGDKRVNAASLKCAPT
jgi:carbonic anhydrase